MNRVALQRQLGRKIRAMRQGRGLTQEAFAWLCGLKPTKIWRIEHGEINPSLTTMVRLARQLEITLAELLRGIN